LQSLSRTGSARLEFRAPIPDDLDGYLALFLDPEVQRWLRPAPQPPFTEGDVFAKLSEDAWHWDEHGFGPWAVLERESGVLIGRGGLRYQTVDGEREVELGWVVRSDRWGRGYATEAATAALEWAREREVTEVVSLIMEDNLASRRVAEKTGFRQAGKTVHAGLDHLVCRLALGTAGTR
jgi:RimJ/RimL family protein N-acetyltransferase